MRMGLVDSLMPLDLPAGAGPAPAPPVRIQLQKYIILDLSGALSGVQIDQPVFSLTDPSTNYAVDITLHCCAVGMLPLDIADKGVVKQFVAHLYNCQTSLLPAIR